MKSLLSKKGFTTFSLLRFGLHRRSLHKLGFTLVELLIVIAILGILSVAVLGAINATSSLNKANLAKAKTFSASIENSLSIDQVGKWSFEEGGGPTAKDTSGYNNDGTLSGTPSPEWQTANQCDLGFGGCLKFNGSSAFVAVPHNSSLDTPNAITLVAWVKRMGDGGTPDPSRGIFLSKDSNYLEARQDYLCMSLNIGGQKFHCAGAGNVSNGKWYHAAGSYNGAKYKIYVNGKEVFSKEYTGSITTGTSQLTIGIYDGGGYFFNGFLDEPAIYNQSLTAYQIQQLYAKGLSRHQLALQ